MRVLVTGSNGFIGKNLILKLNELGHNVNCFTRTDNTHQLEDAIKKSEFIFHLAGENRTDNNQEFIHNNVLLTEALCNFVLRHAKGVPIVFTSSSKATEDSHYGSSKLLAEKHLEALSNTNPVYIYRLPGIFGKWAKPNYNSVVATFCYNIARNIPIDIHNGDNKVELLYIDDLMEIFIDLLETKKTNGIENEITLNSDFISVRKLSEIITKFNEKRHLGMLGDVSIGFEKKLYATFISYLPQEKFTYKLKSNFDKRGSFTEILKTHSAGQFSYFTAAPSQVRGEHYHHTKTEKFLIVSGTARFTFRDVVSNEYFKIDVTADDNTIVQTIPGWAHKIENISDIEMISFVWANEVFDQLNPDTFREEVDK